MARQAKSGAVRAGWLAKLAVLWILAPIACFALGLYLVGPRLVPKAPAPKPAPQSDAGQAAVEGNGGRADEWFDEDKVPDGSMPSGWQRYAGSARPSSDQTEEAPPSESDSYVEVQPLDVPPPEDEQTDQPPTDGVQEPEVLD
jgi:hypothetical protein